MDVAYAASDIVISRAGAIAIAEICFLSKASILIPSSYVTDNHQTVNAQYLKKHNTCIMIKEIELEKKLIESIDYLKEKNRREEMGRLANKLFNYNAARDIASIVLKDITG